MNAKLNLDNDFADTKSIKEDMSNQILEEKKLRDEDLNKCLPVHELALANNVGELQKLFDQKADMNAIGCFWRMTPLQYVIFKNGKNRSAAMIKTVEWLLQHGGAIKLEHTDAGFNRTALHLAALYDQPEIIELLLRYRANYKAGDIEGLPLFILQLSTIM